jgi:hypothetical protein
MELSPTMSNGLRSRSRAWSRPREGLFIAPDPRIIRRALQQVAEKALSALTPFPLSADNSSISSRHMAERR